MPTILDELCKKCGQPGRVAYPSQKTSYCRPCHTVIRLKQKRRYYYGLSNEEWESLKAAQGGGCAVCGGANENGRELHVDHDHETGAVRGLLCGRCNVAIGMANDDPDTLRRLAEYVESHRV